jgi:hypothetical protein
MNWEGMSHGLSLDAVLTFTEKNQKDIGITDP